MIDNVIRRYPIYNKLYGDSLYQLSLATRTALVFNNINEFNIINDVKNKQIKFNDFNISTYSN